MSSKMIVFVTCWIGVAAVAAAAVDEIESLGVSEGENLSISIPIKKSDDPQVLVTRDGYGSSGKSIAQLFCHNGDCEREAWESGVSLIFDGENVTLIFINVRYNQMGLYSVQKLSDTPTETKIYNVTVFQAPLSIISPSVVNSKSFTVGITVLITLVLLISGVIGGVCWKHKADFHKLSQNDDSAASSVCGP